MTSILRKIRKLKEKDQGEKTKQETSSEQILTKKRKSDLGGNRLFRKRRKILNDFYYYPQISEKILQQWSMNRLLKT